MQHRIIHDSRLQPLHQFVLGDRVEVALQVRVVYFLKTQAQIRLDLFDRILR